MMMNLVGIKLLAEVPYSLLFTYFFLNTGSNLTEFVDLVDIQSEKKLYSVILQAQKQTSVVETVTFWDS